MNFPSINIQGNILSGEILEKIATEDMKHQTPQSFSLGKNERVRDEIGRAWSDVRGLWQTFKIRRDRLKEDDSGTTETRNFWMLPFFTTLGYDVEKSTSEVIDNKTYAISHRADNLEGFPVHITGINDSLDKRRETGGPRLSPHGLVQEYLNKTDDHLYALVTNGRHLRLLRDATRLVRLAYLEFDLEKMMEEELFADFAILFRVLHATRMPAKKGEGETSVIEQYHQESLDAGSRIREKLCDAVEYAIKQLANSLLNHPENEYLRQLIREGHLTPTDFYLQSLRLVYRILFLLVIEDRGLVYPEKLDDNGKKLRKAYLSFYSMNRLRHLAGRRIFVEATKHDLWENLKVSFRLFMEARYGQKLNIQPLGSGIFDPEALGSLAETRMNNHDLLEVMQRICYFDDKDRQIRVRVNYGDLDVEEFGSVYEGLLEYKPVFTESGGKIQFAFEAGTERSSSGSHYTPEELVRPLIQHSLDYIIDDCLKKPQERLKTDPRNMPLIIMQEKALLEIKVCDVSCGSGHILLSAARRIANELARVRTGEDQPSPLAMRQAIRDTIRHCIYGVDKNPLAVELCKVALWLEAHNPGEPLNFLDHKIKCGDSIVGLAHREELKNGIADEAFKTLPGDEKEVAAAFRSQNKRERLERRVKETQLATEFEQTTAASVQEAIAEYTSFAALPETNPEEISRKEKAYQRFLDGKGHQWLKLMADLQVTQFFIPKTSENKEYLLTDAPYRQMLAGYRGWQGRPAAKANVQAQDKRFFHWFVEFPEVFEEGGFDCILGNPPYLGGTKITGYYGKNFLEAIKNSFLNAGDRADLVSYFIQRSVALLKKTKSFISLITTNSISQGDTRNAGLQVIETRGGVINFAIKSIRWPGLASVEVALISFHTGGLEVKKVLNNKPVKNINSFLEEGELEVSPQRLYSHKGKSSKGSDLLGAGFQIGEDFVTKFIAESPENTQVICKYLNGNDVNYNYEITSDSHVINFFDFEKAKAKKYQGPFAHVEKNVKPERQRKKKDGTFVLRKPLPEKWWLYNDSRKELYKEISNFSEVFLQTRVTKFISLVRIKNEYVYSDALVVFTFQNFLFFPIIQSTIHNEWAWKFGSTMGISLRYSPSDCFQTFPFPKDFFVKSNNSELVNLGRLYHEHRRQIMLAMQLGLTKTYNTFHAPEIQPGVTTEALQELDKKAIEKQYGKELWNLWSHLQKTSGSCSLEEAIEGIVKLRELHVQMDEAVLEAYGWGDVQLHPDFYEVDYLPENDRIRYAIHPDARKEVLKRLLELNHQYFEEEALQGLHKEEIVRKFYEQIGTAVPEEVNRWFKKGKAYKKPKSKENKASEPEKGYGGLFDQIND